MSDPIESMRFVKDLRHRMNLNRAKGLPEDDGITDEEIEEAIKLLRKDRTSAVAEKSAKTRASNNKEEPLDLKAMLANMRSQNKED